MHRVDELYYKKYTEFIVYLLVTKIILIKNFINKFKNN